MAIMVRIRPGFEARNLVLCTNLPRGIWGSSIRDISHSLAGSRIRSRAAGTQINTHMGCHHPGQQLYQLHGMLAPGLLFLSGEVSGRFILVQNKQTNKQKHTKNPTNQSKKNNLNNLHFFHRKFPQTEMLS